MEILRNIYGNNYMEIYGNTCGHLSESMSISIGNCVVAQ